MQKIQDSKADVAVTQASATVSGGEIKRVWDEEYGEYVGGNAYGAYVYGNTYGNKNPVNITASENTVAVSGGSVAGDAAAVYAHTNVGSINASENTATISGGSVSGAYAVHLYYNEGIPMTANNNTLTISGGNVHWGAAVLSKYHNGGAFEANGNKTIISGIGSVIDENMYAVSVEGFSSNAGTATANNNSISFTDATVYGMDHHGVYLKQGSKRFTTAEVNNNSLTVSGDMVGSMGNIYASHVNEANNATANQNTLTVNTNNGFEIKSIHAARVDGGHVSDPSSLETSENTVSVTSKAGTTLKIKEGVTGGLAHAFTNTDSVKANKNTVSIGSNVRNDNGAFNYGGRATVISGTAKAAEANENTVTVGNDNVLASIYAGDANGQAATANKNSVTVNKSDVRSIYGGYASGTSATANENTINVTNTYEGYNSSTIVASTALAHEDGAALSEGNSMTLEGIEVTLLTAVSKAQSVNGTATSNSNTLTLAGGTDHDIEVFVGQAKSNNGATLASGNKLIANNAAMHTFNTTEKPGGVAAGFATSDTGNATAVNNTIELNGGDYQQGATWKGTPGVGYNSFINAGRAVTRTGAAEANTNEITITDGNFILTNRYDEDRIGTFASELAGGYAKSDEGAAKANGNKLTITGGTFTGDIYGGLAIGATEAEAKDNTVILGAEANLEQASLYGGVATVNTRALPNTENNLLQAKGWQGKVAKLAAFDNIELEDVVVDEDGAIQISDGAADDLADTKLKLKSLAAGQNLTDVDSIILINNANGEDLGLDASSLDGSLEYGMGAIFDGEGISENGKVAFSIKRKRGSVQTEKLAATRAGAAAFVNSGDQLLRDSLDALEKDAVEGVKTFAALGGSKEKYEDLYDLEITGWNAAVGLGKGEATSKGNLSWGAFYEHGKGDYDNINVAGKSNVKYDGLGLAARLKLNNGSYVEGGFRAGQMKHTSGKALADAAGNIYGSKTDNNYYGLQLGVGKVLQLNGQKLDLYGKFFHTYNGGREFTAAGEEFSLDSFNSDRIRVGARLTTGKTWQAYYGLAYEYEFNGDATVAVNGAKAEQSLSGGTAMAELGLVYKTAAPWSLSLNTKGYMGSREGFSGSINATYSF